MIIIIRTPDQDNLEAILSLVESQKNVSVSVIEEPDRQPLIGTRVSMAIENLAHQIKERGIILVTGGTYHRNLALRHNLPALEKLSLEKIMETEKMCITLRGEIKTEDKKEHEAFFLNQKESKRWRAHNFRNQGRFPNQVFKKGQIKR